MSDSVRPHRRQPTRLHRPWDSPGTNSGVDCHFLLQCMKVKIESEVAQWCPTLSDPVDCSLPGSSVHGIFQARVLEWGAIVFSSTSVQYSRNDMRYLTCMRAQFFNHVLFFWDPMDCSPPGFSVHGIIPRTILEWVAISYSRDTQHFSIK